MCSRLVYVCAQICARLNSFCYKEKWCAMSFIASWWILAHTSSHILTRTHAHTRTHTRTHTHVSTETGVRGEFNGLVCERWLIHNGAWLIHVYAMIYLHVREKKWERAQELACKESLMDSFVWLDSFIRGAWLVHLDAMIHAHLWCVYIYIYIYIYVTQYVKNKYNT